MYHTVVAKFDRKKRPTCVRTAVLKKVLNPCCDKTKARSARRVGEGGWGARYVSPE